MTIDTVPANGSSKGALENHQVGACGTAHTIQYDGVVVSSKAAIIRTSLNFKLTSSTTIQIAN